jgi:FAD/FMN-containing dehydrogenase
MTGVAIDPVARTARIEAGVCWQQLVDQAARSGLAPLTGSSPTVGVGRLHARRRAVRHDGQGVLVGG